PADRRPAAAPARREGPGSTTEPGLRLARPVVRPAQQPSTQHLRAGDLPDPDGLRRSLLVGAHPRILSTENLCDWKSFHACVMLFTHHHGEPYHQVQCLATGDTITTIRTKEGTSP